MFTRLLVSLALNLPLAASVVTLQYSGTITTSTLTSVPVGSAFSGTFSYDTAAMGIANVFGVTYTTSGSSATAGTENMTSTTGVVGVFNDLTVGLDFLDRLGWGGTGSLTASSALHTELVNFNLINRFFGVNFLTFSAAAGAGPLSSTGLPEPFPAFDSATFQIGGSRTIDAMMRSASGPITSLTVVPEPGTFALVGLALAAFDWRRGRSA